MSCHGERIYLVLNYPSQSQTKTLLTGIKQDLENSSIYYITGFIEENPKTHNTKIITTVGKQSNYTTFVYKGNLSGISISNKDNWHIFNYPSSEGKTVNNTNLYGPSIFKNTDNFNVVGNYTTIEDDEKLFGCLYQGKLDELGKWLTIMPPKSIQTICHSTMSDLIVGNYLVNSTKNSKAFVYNIKTNKYIEVIKKRSVSITAYGIWQNSKNGKDSKNHYTIAGGYSEKKFTGDHLAYVCDYDNKTQEFSNWQSYTHNNEKGRITHFEGISAYGKGYSLPSDATVDGEEVASMAYIKRKKDGTFSSKCKWENISVPNKNICSSNSVAGSTVIGVATSNPEVIDGFVSILI